MLKPDYPENPFSELPQALIEDLLVQCDTLSTELSVTYQEIHNQKSNLKANLLDKGILKSDSDLLSTHTYPTTCGIDGGYAIERLLSTDLVAIASVAVEGLTPPTETRHWERPHHLCKMITVNHHEKTSLAARGIMLAKELHLATKAPHDVIFLDGSFTTPFIHFSQALSAVGDMPENISELLVSRINEALNNYKDLIFAKKSDKQFVTVPKYTTNQQLTQNILTGINFEDRAILSLLLNGGEYISPLPFPEPKREWWHITSSHIESDTVISEIVSGLRKLHFVYYRPYQHSPTIRLEIPSAIAKNDLRLARVLEAIKLQCGTPGIMEPYPLYLADRMVKQLSKAVPAIRKTAAQEMLRDWAHSESDIYFLMHGYRTEWGK